MWILPQKDFSIISDTGGENKMFKSWPWSQHSWPSSALGQRKTTVLAESSNF